MTTTADKRALAGGRAEAKAAVARRADERRLIVARRSAARKTRSGAAVVSTAGSRIFASAAAGSRGVLIAEGDSWFDYPLHDVLKMLEDRHDYDVESVAHMGDRVEDMAYAEGQLDALLRRIEKVVGRGGAPRAILLSGGGNDVTGEALAMLLDHAKAGHRSLNEDIVRGVIDQRLRHAYVTILSAVTSVCRQTLGTNIRIVIHGYDYPVPDGRGFLGGWGPLPGPWLEPALRRKGYADLAQNVTILETLIDRFNEMLSTLPRIEGLGHTRYVDLRKTLSRATKGNAYRGDWGNELHPTRTGFEKVAKKIAKAIEVP